MQVRRTSIGTVVSVAMFSTAGACLAVWLCHIALVYWQGMFKSEDGVKSAIVLESASCLVLIGKAGSSLGDSRASLPLLTGACVVGFMFGAIVGFLFRNAKLVRGPYWAFAFGATWSLIMTAGSFALLNDVFVAGWQNDYSSAARRAARHSIRDAFLQDVGRSSVPAELMEQEVNDFVGKHSHLKELISEGDKISIPKFAALLENSDAKLQDDLRGSLGLVTSVLAKPANTCWGYSDPGSSAVTWGTPPAIRSHTSESIRRAVLVAIEPKPDEAKLSELRVAEASTLAGLLAADLGDMESSAWVSLARRSNGIVQFLGILPFFFGVSLVALRVTDRTEAPYLRLEELFTRNPILRATREERAIGTVAARAARRILESESKASQSEGRQLVDRLVLDTLRAFLANGDPHDAAQSVDGYTEHALNRMYSEHGLLRFVVWVIPLIGFMGTLIGIGNGLMKANALVDPGVDPAAALQGVVSELGLAFDITALMASMVLMFAFYLLQRSEEKTILKITEEVSQNIVRRLERRGWSFERIELKFKMTKDGTGRFQKDYSAPGEYSLRILELFGRDPHIGYSEKDPARMTVRISNVVGHEGNLPAQGLPLDLELGTKHFTADGLFAFVTLYFGWDTTPSDLASHLQSWCSLYPDSENFKQLSQQLSQRS